MMSVVTLAVQLFLLPYPMPCDYQDALPPLCPADYGSPDKRLDTFAVVPFKGWLANGDMYLDEPVTVRKPEDYTIVPKPR